MIKLVLFDMDNTLVDFYNMKIRCLKEAFKAMKKEGLDIKIKKGIKKIIEIYKESSFDRQDAFQELLKRETGTIDYRILSAGIVGYRKVRYNVLKPYKGVVDVLKFLKYNKLRIGVVTDAPELSAWIRLTTADISEYFNKVIAGVKKPNKMPFKKALKSFDVKAENTVFIGDNIVKDIYGANRVGMKTIFAKYGDFLEQKQSSKHKKPDYVAKEVDDIRRIIKKII